MSDITTTLTTGDFMILEVMQKHCIGCSDTFSLILKQKIDSAIVVFRDDLPDDVASLNSRIAFSVNGKNNGTRVIAHDHVDYPVGISLPITTVSGLALLGLAEGQAFVVPNADGTKDRIVLDKVFFQPQAERRGREAMNRTKTPAERRADLKIFPGGIREFKHPRPSAQNGRVDRGPSTA
jgi:regulator of nucleoside diphosphate kinase